jgi:hypothetical protein
MDNVLSVIKLAVVGRGGTRELAWLWLDSKVIRVLCGGATSTMLDIAQRTAIEIGRKSRAGEPA